MSIARNTAIKAPAPSSTPSCSATPSARRGMREIFSDRALIERYIEVEVALARAEARCGVIPAEAADVIARESRLERIDFDHMREETDIVGYPILPLVHQLVAMCGEAGRYVHWGATTQDIMDTANVLQMRAALDIVDADIRELRRILADLATKHRDTPMAGRTHLQQALPVTFGYKVAIWLAMFDRHQERLAELRKRVLVVEFAGAAGTLASLGDKGFEVQKALAEELGARRAGHHLARGARRLRRSREPARADHRLARQDRARRHDHGVDRVRRGLRALRQGSRREQHDAAEAQPDLQRADAGRGQGRAPARRPDGRRDDPGLRARHRPVARRVDRDAGELHPHAPAPCTRPSSRSAG